MKCKIIALVLIISLTCVTTISAIAWIPIVYQATLRIASSLGSRVVIARAVIAKEAVRNLIKGALLNPSAGKHIAWELIGTSTLAGAAMYLLTDFSDHVAETSADPDIVSRSEPTYYAWSSDDGHWVVTWEIVEDKMYYAGTYYGGEVTYNCQTNGTSAPSEYGPSEVKLGVWFRVYEDGVRKTQKYVGPCNRSITVKIIAAEAKYGPGTETDNSVISVSDAALDEWMDENEADIRSSPTVITLTPPAVYINGGTIVPDVLDEGKTEAGVVTDTRTMLDQTPKVDEDLGTFTPPPQPGDPIFDMTPYDLPQLRSFEEIMEPYTEEDPVGNFMEDFTISGTGLGQVSIPLPTGGEATMDFGEFDDIYAQLRVIIIAFAYIYGIMIFFKGT